MKALKIEHILAIVSAVLTFFAFYVIFEDISANESIFYLCLAINLLISLNIYWLLSKKYRAHRTLLRTPPPKEWQPLLENTVRFFEELNQSEKNAFLKRCQLFLHSINIIGVETKIDEQTRILIAASAIIPVFHFPQFTYTNLEEVLVYPSAFNVNFKKAGKKTANGMVGKGILANKMILSQKALIAGFSNEQDKINVGIHEFVHLIDGMDGAFDGVPNVLMDKSYVLPWIDRIYLEIQKIKSNRSKINPYGATNKAEFFAVASEFFFEQPTLMKRKYPELFQLMEITFTTKNKNPFAAKK